MTKRLLAVQGPLQFITGYIAFDWHRRMQAQARADEAVLLLYDFLAPPDIEPSIAEAVRQLCRVAPWSKIVFISGPEMTCLVQGRYANSMRRLKNVLGVEHFDEIFLAREHTGYGSALLMNAYASATKYAYGDSLGLVGQPAPVRRFDRRSPLRSTLSMAKHSARRLLLGGPKAHAFDTAVLPIPLDMSGGNYFSKTRLVVPPLEHVAQCVRSIASAAESLGDYCRSLYTSAGHPQGAYLYLLSNLAGSGLTSIENETALYVDIVTSTAKKGDTIFLKQHPRSTREVLDGVTNRLKDNYHTIVLEESRFSRLPIELWSYLIDRCAIVAIFSTSAINIKYLYQKDVILPLTPQRLEKYFPRNSIEFMSTANRLIQESIEKLEHWDQNSVLWTKYA
jgi:hypothetical protein